MRKINLNTYRLRGLLKKESRDLFKRHELLWKFALDNYLKFMNVEDYTNHGEDHVLNIEKSVYSLITEKAREKLSPFEIFCLLSAICLHDLGMIVKEKMDEQYFSVRKDHHIRVRQLLEERHNEFQLNQQEAKIIGEICYGHGTPSLDDLEAYDNWSVAPFGEVNAVFLTALLRIGDLIDLSFLRAPKLVADLRKISGESLNHWKLHNKISDIKIDHENEGISIFATADNEYDLSELYKLRNWIESELTIVREAFEKNGVFLNTVSLHTNLDKKKVLSKENPFLKLASFDWSKHMAFFGRDREIADIKKKIIPGKLLVLVGESGVGKTSLLKAGLKQRLIEKGFYVFEIRISDSFQDEFLKNVSAQFSEIKSRDVFHLLGKVSSEKLDLIVFIDQFEELFTFYGHNDVKGKMLSFLEKILNSGKINTKIILSLREDFLAELWEVSARIPVLYNRVNTYRLKKLSRENAKEAITNTIEYINYSIDDELVQHMLDDFTQEDEGIYPPYIQIVCHETFKHHKDRHKEKSEETPLSLAVYESLGGADKIIADYFKEILDGFNYEERTVINEILAPMITYFHTKQRISYEEILKINEKRIDIDKTLSRLIDHRIIKKIETEKNEYELIHDFLAKKILENKPAMGISSSIKKAIEFIETNFDRPISLQEVSGSVRFSREHFCRLFKAETGELFTDYINKRRIEEAKKYMKKDPRIKIIEVYPKVGFTNQQHFTKTFKKFTGNTPNEYKRTLIE